MAEQHITSYSAATPLSVTTPFELDTTNRAEPVEPLHILASLRGAGPYERLFKPALDRIVAGVLLLVLAPLMAVFALAVAATLGRPMLYRQTRVGLGGAPFEMLKFRTMRPCRRQSDGGYVGPERRRTHKSPSDPRLTRLGRVLRRYSLDELPQLWNVVRGDMSLVGPRPELVEIVARYQPWQHRRHAVKPGITGLWQVTERAANGGRMHECTRTDLHYIDDLSFGTDVRILLRTVPSLFGIRRGF
jgi:lipopolysaccharide/colanic/teichoic acid biosynthesis glycosyltransferase